MTRFFVILLMGFGILSGPALAASAHDFEGLIHPSEFVKLSSQVTGVLEEVFVERGDIVTKGQAVASLKAGLERVAVKLAQTNLDFLQRKKERNVDMARKKLISANDLDELETEQKKAEHQLEEAQERLKAKTIFSTIDGVVVERMLAPGDYVGEAPIFKLARLDPLKVEIIVPVKQFGSIKSGMKAEVRPEQPVGGVYIGKVTIVDKVIDAASNTFVVRVDIPNPALKIPSGLRCRVRFLK